MRLSPQGYSALVQAEGMRLEAYPDPASGGDPWTIGIGCTTYRDGSPVKKGDVLTYGEAHSLAAWHIERIEAELEPAIAVPVDPYQWDALVSLAFNIGTGAFKSSTLLKKLNAGDYHGAAGEFDRWVHAAGKVMPGLVTRRAHERAMFEGSLPPAAPIRDAVPPIYPPIQSLKDIVTGKEPVMPAPFLVLAANALSALLPTLIRMKSSSPNGELNAQIAEKVMPIVQAAVGATNAQEAVERIANDPAALLAAEKAVRENYLSLEEAGGGGIEGAREFNLKAADKPLLRQPAFVISVILMLFPLIMVVDVFFVHPGNFTSELRTQVVTGILLVISIVGGYWLGSSASSRTKDELIAKRP